jgi:transposase
MDYIDTQVQQLIADHTTVDKDYKLMRTINSVGPQGAALLACQLSSFSFTNSDALIGFSGVDLRPQDSGKKQGKRRLSKRGDAMIRRQMRLCAISASRSSTFKPQYQAMQAREILKVAALVIVARKLLRVAFAVWKSCNPFDESVVWQKPSADANML